MSTNKHFWRHFLTYFQNTFSYFNKTYHNNLLLGPHDIGDIFKVTASKAKVKDNFSSEYHLVNNVVCMYVCMSKNLYPARRKQKSHSRAAVSNK